LFSWNPGNQAQKSDSKNSILFKKSINGSIKRTPWFFMKIGFHWNWLCTMQRVKIQKNFCCSKVERNRYFIFLIKISLRKINSPFDPDKTYLKMNSIFFWKRFLVIFFWGFSFSYLELFMTLPRKHHVLRNKPILEGFKTLLFRDVFLNTRKVLLGSSP